MDKLDLSTNQPWGMCAQCRERMAAGAQYEAVELPGGAKVIHAYCAHREVGATLLVRADRPLRWRIMTPIDAIEWKQYLALQARHYAGALRALADSAGDR